MTKSPATVKLVFALDIVPGPVPIWCALPSTNKRAAVVPAPGSNPSVPPSKSSCCSTVTVPPASINNSPPVTSRASTALTRARTCPPAMRTRCTTSAFDANSAPFSSHQSPLDIPPVISKRPLTGAAKPNATSPSTTRTLPKPKPAPVTLVVPRATPSSTHAAPKSSGASPTKAVRQASTPFAKPTPGTAPIWRTLSASMRASAPVAPPGSASKSSTPFVSSKCPLATSAPPSRAHNSPPSKNTSPAAAAPVAT